MHNVGYMVTLPRLNLDWQTDSLTPTLTKGYQLIMYQVNINPLTHGSARYINSPYIFINTMSSRQVVKLMKKIINLGIWS